MIKSLSDFVERKPKYFVMHSQLVALLSSLYMYATKTKLNHKKNTDAKISKTLVTYEECRMSITVADKQLFQCNC